MLNQPFVFFFIYYFLAKDWNATEYAEHLPLDPDQYKLILPLVLRYLVPTTVSFFGLGAISAAVMSSADSSVLSASSMFARNVWKSVVRQKASEYEILWVMRIGIALVTLLATIMGLTIKSVYGLWFLCSDLVYVVLFPQLCCVVYMRNTNTYGSIVAYFMGIFLRLSAGEAMFNLEPLIKFPGFEEATGIQKFPFRTLSMLTSFFLIITVSLATNFIFENDYLSKKWDVFQCVTNIPHDTIALNQSTTIDELTRINNASSNNIRYDLGANGEGEKLTTANTAILNFENKIELHESIITKK